MSRNRWGFEYDPDIHGKLTPHPADVRVARKIIACWDDVSDLDRKLRIVETDDTRTPAQVRLHIAVRNILNEEYL